MKYLDPQVVAMIVNQNGVFLGNLIGQLSPVVIADVINNNGPFLSAVMGTMDPQNTAQTTSTTTIMSQSKTGKCIVPPWQDSRSGFPGHVNDSSQTTPGKP